MAQVIQFLKGQWKLQIEVNPDNWCECKLVSKTRTYLLGAEELYYIGNKLSTALCDHNEQAAANGQYPYQWVLTLAEGHSSLYIIREGDDKCLIWQDADANTLAEICLSSDDRLIWCKQLNQLMSTK